jgi:SM-20-related protein
MLIELVPQEELALDNSELHSERQSLFDTIASDLMGTGYSINQNALSVDLCVALSSHLEQMNAEKFTDAGVGRGTDYTQVTTIRKDAICWITGESSAGKLWLEWASELQLYLNRRLFLGLFCFESHFAHYRVGDFYVRHCDAFRGQQNRVLTVVVYLNKDWTAQDGGELILYKNESDLTGLMVEPTMGTVVVFLSEEFPHEVLPTVNDRYSIAGWFRVNVPDLLL